MSISTKPPFPELLSRAVRTMVMTLDTEQLTVVRIEDWLAELRLAWVHPAGSPDASELVPRVEGRIFPP